VDFGRKGRNRSGQGGFGVALEYPAVMKAVDGEGDGQMEAARVSQRPEDKLPVVEPAFAYYSQQPYRL